MIPWNHFIAGQNQIVLQVKSVFGQRCCSNPDPRDVHPSPLALAFLPSSNREQAVPAPPSPLSLRIPGWTGPSESCGTRHLLELFAPFAMSFSVLYCALCGNLSPHFEPKSGEAARLACPACGAGEGAGCGHRWDDQDLSTWLLISARVRVPIEFTPRAVASAGTHELYSGESVLPAQKSGDRFLGGDSNRLKPQTCLKSGAMST